MEKVPLSTCRIMCSFYYNCIMSKTLQNPLFYTSNTHLITLLCFSVEIGGFFEGSNFLLFFYRRGFTEKLQFLAMFYSELRFCRSFVSSQMRIQQNSTLRLHLKDYLSKRPQNLFILASNEKCNSTRFTKPL